MAVITYYTFKVETWRRRMKDIEIETWEDLERITMAIDGNVLISNPRREGHIAPMWHCKDC
jgi:hypothetical protein